MNARQGAILMALSDWRPGVVLQTDMELCGYLTPDGHLTDTARELAAEVARIYLGGQPSR